MSESKDLVLVYGTGKNRSDRFVLDRLGAPEVFQELVIYEDNHLLVVDKPVGIATQGSPANEESLFTLAQNYVKRKYNKPGNVYLGVVSRLDLPVSGVVVFARTSKAAERLNCQFREHSVEKTYQALAQGRMEVISGAMEDFICEDRRTQQRWVSRTQVARQANQSSQIEMKEAKLSYRVLELFKNSTLVEVKLLTGRKHQIRLQFASRGFPLIGDGKYGAKPISHRGICLHASELVITHPTQKSRLRFQSPHPNWDCFVIR